MRNREDLLFFDNDTRRSFQMAWERAEVFGIDQFEFEGQIFDTSYARSLVEHINNTLVGA